MRLTLGYQVLIAVILAIGVGLFFGPLSSTLRPIADAFSMLLQMVVLPYIAFSLMHGLGSLTPDVAKRLFKKGWFLLVLLWVIVFGAIYIADILIPVAVAGPANYTRIGAHSFSQNLLGYIIPQNPIYDFANNVVPAVAIFGLILGAAFMHLKNKEPLLSLLERSNKTMEKIFEWLALLSPIGIFAHIAQVVGTVKFEELLALELYVVFYIVIVLFLSFVILPAILSSLTPLSYREALMEMRFACILAFTTGLPSLAFPFINKAVKRVGKEFNLEGERFHNKTQTIIPIGYSFAQLGNCMMLFFLFFISFYYRHPFTFSEKSWLTILSIPLSFGAGPLSINGISFLIEQLSFNKEAVSLFVETSAITLNFQVLLSVVSIFTFIFLVLFSYFNRLRINLKKFLKRVLLPFAIFALLVVIGKYTYAIPDKYINLYQKLRMADILEERVPGTIIEKEKIAPQSIPSPGILAHILKEGVLRVGYDPRNIPFCYWNDQQELVGYDVAFAYQLAKDLDCKLEFVEMSMDKLGQELSTGLYDIGMAAVLMTEDRLLKMDFTHTYDEEQNVLVIPRSKQKEFRTEKQILQRKDIRLGGAGGYRDVIRRHFPNAIIVPIKTWEEILEGKVDALAWSRIPAFVWCLAHPEYMITDVDLYIGKKYFAYPVRTGEENWVSFLNNWLLLKQEEGFASKQYAYWIEGQKPISPEPRWSILRNVLHWIN